MEGTLMARSKKTDIVEGLFRERHRESGQLSDPVVTLEDVAKAIRNTEGLSSRNPANFFKDFIRNRESANRNWPQAALDAGYTARQLTGSGMCFEFVPLPSEEKEAFPSAKTIHPTERTPKHRVESVSMPLASRRLGRADEPWLMQVAARLRIVEAHFSLFSPRAVEQVDLLQLNVTLRKGEIDAMYLLQERTEEGSVKEVIVTCEAKQGRDDILEDQIINQARSAFKLKSVDQDLVVPIAIKCIPPGSIHVVEFTAFERATAEETTLVFEADSLHEIYPPVPGICGD
ncbi:hypothetical protein BH11ARM2_BH11ARM2_35120 [soil metagenome]